MSFHQNNPFPSSQQQYAPYNGNQFNQIQNDTQPQFQSSNPDQLSFLAPSDQAKFQKLFDNSTNSLSISPEAARSILLKSNLSPHHLARIWELADINKTGDLMFPEFALALHLCNIVLRGGDLPYVLDPQIKQEVSNLVDKISFNIPEGTPDQGNLPTPNKLQRSTTDDILETAPVSSDIPQSQPLYQQQPLQQQQQQPVPSLNSQPTGFGFGNNNFLNYQPTGLANQTQSSNLQSQATGFAQGLNQPVTQQPTGYNAFDSVLQPSQQQQPPPQTQTQTLQQPQQPQSQQPQSNGLVQQQTGYTQAPAQQNLTNQLTQQPTGLVPLQTQSTGARPLTQQPTGLVPLQNQATGTRPLAQQPTGLVPLQNQATGTAPLNQQPTGLVPLQSQQTGPKPLNQQPTGLIPLPTQTTGGQPLTQQPTGLIPLPTGSKPPQPLTQQPTGLVPLQSVQTGSLQPQRTGFGAFEPLKQQKTGVGQNSFFLTNLLQDRPGPQALSNNIAYANETITPQEKQLFNKIFDNYDTSKKGLISADVSAEIFRKSGLNREELEIVWDLITRPNQTHLDKESFQIGMWLVYKRLNGYDLPDVLPESLKPASLHILDDVKRQLKTNTNNQRIKKTSSSKIDGSRFKNNDDEIKISSSRHRRRAKTGEDVQPTTQHSIDNEKLSIEELKKRIHEKKILLDALDVGQEDLAEQSKIENDYDLAAIEDLKTQLANLPVPGSSSSDNGRSRLKARFNQLSSQIPRYISQITDVDNEITNLKLEFYKIKNPSSIIGTGPNGTITDADRRKAKSKALLAIKMAKLTGKPIDPEIEAISTEESKLSEEVVKIQEESKRTQQAIKDLQNSIDDLSNGIQSALSTSKVNEEDYKKWELGIGLQPEVQEIVKKFRTIEVSTKFSNFSASPTTSASPVQSQQKPQETYVSPVTTTATAPAPAPVNVESPVVASSPTVSTPTHQSAEDRREYIRQQARERMNERMAKLGISRPSSRVSSGSRVSSPSLPQSVSSPVPEVQPQTQPQAVAEPAEDSSSDDDDEEEYQRLEEIRRLKRLERDARLAELRELGEE